MNNPGHNPPHRPQEQSAFDVDDEEDAQIAPNRGQRSLEDQMQAVAPGNLHQQNQESQDRESWNLMGNYSNVGQDNDIS